MTSQTCSSMLRKVTETFNFLQGFYNSSSADLIMRILDIKANAHKLRIALKQHPHSMDYLGSASWCQSKLVRLKVFTESSPIGKDDSAVKDTQHRGFDTQGSELISKPLLGLEEGMGGD